MMMSTRRISNSHKKSLEPYLIDSIKKLGTFSPSQYTVAVWTEKQFIPLLMRPQGSPGCQKMRQDPLNSNLEVCCPNMEPKLHNL